MSNVYEKFKEAWVDRAVVGNSVAGRLAKARSTMKAQPDYDEAKYHAALFAAEAEYHHLLRF
jgi:hypothetical protein